MIYIQENSNDPMYFQIYLQIKEDIIQRNIVHGERLPGIRTLARTLGIALNTVSRAYAQIGLLIRQKESASKYIP